VHHPLISRPESLEPQIAIDWSGRGKDDIAWQAVRAQSLMDGGTKSDVV
jgi:hypothetical protein